jgi:uncharacterized membrane protein YedE/YeeE
MESFTPIASTIGGVLIGIAAAGLLMFHGRIAGISGIAGGIFRREPGDMAWRVMFVVGLLAAAVPSSAAVAPVVTVCAASGVCRSVPPSRRFRS